MKQAMYYEGLEDDKVRCRLCPHGCTIKPAGIGLCGARKNVEGALYSMNYGKIASAALDPIEKKPLNLFRPGSRILSVGTFGCNLKCSFCQNWSIAHREPDAADAAPEDIVEEAVRLTAQGNIGVAYTYNEPSIWYEFVYETAGLVKERGLSNVLVTNGFISREPLLELLPFIDAMNIDVKAFTPGFYRDICKASANNGKSALDIVKETVELSADKCHVEVTTLVIPGLNDTVDEISALASWLSSVDPEIPLHLSRFFPAYKMADKAPTPVGTLQDARNAAAVYLKHVFLGNV